MKQAMRRLRTPGSNAMRHTFAACRFSSTIPDAQAANPNVDAGGFESRLKAIESEMASMRRYIKEVETRNPSLAAEVSASMGTVPIHATAYADPNAVPLDPGLLEDLYEFYGLQPVEFWPLREFMRIQTADELVHLAAHVHREYLVRLAGRARTLRQAPLGLAQMPSIRELRRWYETSFADMRSVENLKTREDLISFDATVRRILRRHRNTADLLSSGLIEFASREQILAERKLIDSSKMKMYREVQDFFDTFCDTRVRLRFMLGHHAALSARLLADDLPKDADASTTLGNFGLDPETFVGHICSQTDARKVVLSAIRHARESELEDTSLIPPIVLQVNQSNIAPYVYDGKESSSHGTPFLYHSAPYVLNGSTIAMVGEAIRSNVIRKLRYGIDCEPITVTITQGSELSDVTVTVTDTAGGMALPVLKTSHTCVSSCRAFVEERQLCKKGSASFNKTGCGWGHCPIRMPYALVASRVFGGDVNISSLEGVGTSRTLFIPTNLELLEGVMI